MSEISCTYLPYVDDKPSELYKDILDKTNNRPLTNFIYAAYLQKEVAAKMDNEGFRRNSQNQHNVLDVFKFLDINKLLDELRTENSIIAKANGVEDNNGLINFTSFDEAYQKALKINNDYTGKVARVIQQNEVFNVLVEDKTAITQLYSAEVKKQLNLWETLKTELNNNGISIEDLSNINIKLFNPLKLNNIISYLYSLKTSSNNTLNKDDIKVLLTMNKQNNIIKNLLSRWNTDINGASDKIYDILYNPSSYAEGITSTINTLLDNCKDLGGFDVSVFEEDVKEITSDLEHKLIEYGIEHTLNELYRKYDIDVSKIIKVSDKIKTLSDVVTSAIFTLQRQIRNIKNKQANTSEQKYKNLEQGKVFEKLLDDLLQELQQKQYYSGLLNFMKQAELYYDILDTKYKQLSNTESDIAHIQHNAHILSQIKAFHDAYEFAINAIRNIDNIIIDGSISNDSIKELKKLAIDLQDKIHRQKDVISSFATETMTNLLTMSLGDTSINGEPIANIVQMSNADSSIYDYLYSMSRVSNPIISVVGGIISQAQEKRNADLEKIQKEIGRIRQEFITAHKKRGLPTDTSFMYEMVNGQYRIISDIDWQKYYKLRGQQYHRLKEEGLKGLSLEQALNIWEEENTEEVPVSNNRTERVPIFKKEVSFKENWTRNQRIYYNQMMHLRGRIGDLLPSYAQNQYLAPQIRKSWIDVISDGIKNKESAKAIAVKLLKRISELTKIKEDDTFYATNGIVTDKDESYVITKSDYDNTVLKQIPLFYFNKLENQNDLLLDFSTGLQRLAATALNYYYMNSIKDVVEMMQEGIHNAKIKERQSTKDVVDVVKSGETLLVKQLYKKATSSNTNAIIDGFVDKYIYGINMVKPDYIKNGRKWAIFWRNLIGYTSTTKLAVNVKGAISNTLVGEFQILIEAGAGEFFNIKDWMASEAILFKDYTINAPSAFMDHLMQRENSKARLLANMFDPLQDNYSDMSSKRYYDSPIRTLFGGFNALGMYTAGEKLIHYRVMYCILNHNKVKVNGETMSLYDALEVQKEEHGFSDLKIKDGAKALIARRDSDGNIIKSKGKIQYDEVEITQEYFDRIKAEIKDCNQKLHGSMNTEDKGLIHQRMLGKAVMNFRQWMVEHFSRRYRTKYWNAHLNRWEEGYYITTYKFLRDTTKDLFRHQTEIIGRWGHLDDQSKANIKRAMTEMVMVFCLTLLSLSMGAPDDHEGEFWYRMFMYQVKRLILDEKASIPFTIDVSSKQKFTVGMVNEFFTLMNSPMACLNTVKGALYPITGLGDISDTIQRGRYEGENKYWTNIKRYSLPFYGQIDQLMHMDEEDYVFNVFNEKFN